MTPDEIEQKVKAVVDPLSMALSDPMEIVEFGPDAVPIVISLFNNPVTGHGCYNQAMLACALVGFAKAGDLRAEKYLKEVANGKVALSEADGDAAFKICQDFCFSLVGLSTEQKTHSTEERTMTECPECGAPASLVGRREGTRYKCVNCHFPYVVPGNRASPVSTTDDSAHKRKAEGTPAGGEVAHQTQTVVRWRCPACNTRLKSPIAAIGKAMRCPRCRASQVISPPIARGNKSAASDVSRGAKSGATPTSAIDRATREAKSTRPLRRDARSAETKTSEAVRRPNMHASEPSTTMSSGDTPFPDHTTEPWLQFKQYVRIQRDSTDSDLIQGMRFQFMFRDKPSADKILIGLPAHLRSALQKGRLWHNGPECADEPKYEGWIQLGWDGVRMTVGDGKELMNRVVNSGGAIYEAFLR